MIRYHRYSRWLLLGLLALGLTGCGKGIKNPVEGTVTVANGPPPNGLVEFSPDLDAKNDGPNVTLWLKDGHFSSVQDKKTMVTGEHHVTVTVAPTGAKYVPAREYRFRANIPEGGASNLTFDVTPKSRGKKRGA